MPEHTKPCLYILCGLPFSGKSTLARAMAGSPQIALVAMDRVNDELGQGLDGEAISPEQWTKTYAECFRRIAGSLDSGGDTVFDAPSFTRLQRDQLRELARAHGATARVIYVDVPAEEARRRWQSNKPTLERHDVREEDFALVLSNLEPPSPDENPLIFTGSPPPAEWLRSVLLPGPSGTE